MPRVTSRAISPIVHAAAALVLMFDIAQAATYAVRVRWNPSTGPSVAGYRITVRTLSGGSFAVVNAGLPAPAPDGSLAAQVPGLDGRTDYTVTVTAYATGGAESAPSNAMAIGYAQVAGRIDTDGDGLTDATEDRNLNRTVDAGETSALIADTDGDGVGDASDQCQGTTAGAAVNPAGCSCAQVACSGTGATLWPSTAVPARADRGADNAAELGVKFRSDVAGYVTGIRFYKHALNTGTHVGNLWSSTGTRLATAMFSGESGSGWQQVTFAQPVAIAANTTYVASYYCPNGHYSFDVSYFATQGIDRAPLHAPASGSVGGNGVYRYGATSVFPNQTYGATNYWVDVVFSTGTAPPPRAITITTAALPAGTVGSAYNTALAATGSTLPYTWSIASGALPAGLAMNASSGVIAGTPTGAGGLSSFTVQARAGSQTATKALSIRVDPPSAAQSLWPSTATPARADRGADNAAELGVKFRSDVAGYVTGIRFYKHALNTGTHVGNLWSSTGTRLATATFTSESASGWQQVTFAQPVAIAANTTYVASYYCPNGHYSFDVSYFATQGTDRAPLHAPASGSVGGNGVYRYGMASAFPNQTYGATNYWVDVAFSTTAAAAAGGVVSGITASSSADDARRSSIHDERDVAHPTAACSLQRGGRVRRFHLKRTADGYHLAAVGRFGFPDGLDLVTSGLTVVVEDGDGQPLVTAELSGADLETTPDGWRSRAGTSGVERLVVRRRGSDVVVALRGLLPAFALPTPPQLSWRLAFGSLCSDTLALGCTDDARGNRRCRGWPAAATVRGHALRDR